MPSARDKAVSHPVVEDTPQHEEECANCDCSRDSSSDSCCDEGGCAGMCDSQNTLVGNPWECRGREASEWMRHETTMLWQKFSTFLGITVLLIAALAFGTHTALRAATASLGLLFTILMYVLVDRSWKYHCYYYKHSDVRQLIENDVKHNHILYGVGSKGTMKIIFGLVFLFWVAVLVAGMFFIQFCFFGPNCVAF